LALELHRQDQAPGTWKYGLAPLSAAELEVRFDGREVWKPDRPQKRTADDPYWLYTAPATQVAQLPARATLHGHVGQVWFASWSPDGKRLLTGGDDKNLRLWSAGVGVWRAPLQPTPPAVFGTAYSPDGKTLATACGDRTVRLWDASSGKMLAVL